MIRERDEYDPLEPTMGPHWYEVRDMRCGVSFVPMALSGA
jgi:hypothetical protein